MGSATGCLPAAGVFSKRGPVNGGAATKGTMSAKYVECELVMSRYVVGTWSSSIVE